MQATLAQYSEMIAVRAVDEGKERQDGARAYGDGSAERSGRPKAIRPRGLLEKRPLQAIWSFMLERSVGTPLTSSSVRISQQIDAH